MTFPTRLDPTSNAADWDSQTLELFDADTGDDVSAAGFAIAGEVVNQRGGVALTFSTASGEITISGNAISWLIPAARMADLTAGTYAVYLRTTDPVSGDVDQLLATQIQIYEGGFR